MKTPKFLDELTVDTGVTSMASSRDGTTIAIGTVGMLGVYRIKEKGKQAGFHHVASYVVPKNSDDNEFAVTHLSFSSDGEVLHLKSEDGVERALSLKSKQRGMLQELHSAGESKTESLVA